MERLWTKSFILMTAGTLFLFNAFYMLYPTLPLFIKQIGGNEVQVGLSTGAFMLTSVLIRPIVGGLLDRYGRRPFIVWGLMLFILAMYLYDWIGGIVIGGITTFVPLFADSIKVNSGVFFLAFAATLALSRPLSGKLSDRYGEMFVTYRPLLLRFWR